MTAPFETDSEGNVILKPVTGWNIAPVAGVAVLLQFVYLDSETDTDGKRIQFVLKPDVCLELAEVLTRQAERLLQTPPGTPLH